MILNLFSTIIQNINRGFSLEYSADISTYELVKFWFVVDKNHFIKRNRGSQFLPSIKLSRNEVMRKCI